ERRRPVDRRHRRRAAERRERERDPPREDHVEAFALEDVVREDGKDDVEVARGAAHAADVPLAREAEARAVVDAARNRDGERALGEDAPVAAAIGARILHLLARAAALGARPRDREEALPVLHAPLSAARRARGCRDAAPPALARARLAALVAADRDLPLAPE